MANTTKEAVMMSSTEYEQIKEWAQAAEQAFQTHGHVMPQVRQEDLEIVGTLRVRSGSLTLVYTRPGGKTGYQVIAPRWIDDGHVQVKTGGRYVDVRNLLGQPEGR